MEKQMNNLQLMSELRKVSTELEELKKTTPKLEIMVYSIDGLKLYLNQLLSEGKISRNKVDEINKLL
jgi:hypothetical protein